MSEKKKFYGEIKAGENVYIEVFEEKVGGNITIRLAEQPGMYITLGRSVIPKLIELLKEVD